jgi:thiamine-monophosphate kinase
VVKHRALAVALGPGVEFELIERLAEEWGPRAQGLGDDAAVIPIAPGMNLIVSIDTSVEGVHFTREWLTAEEIGYRSTMAALSDLAAMGAEPLGVLVALVIPRSSVDDRALGKGIGEAVADVGARVLGGDLSRGRDLSICVTAIGSAAEPLSRASAQPGDLIYLTGRLGAPAAALASFRAGRKPAAAHRTRFARPRARIAEALWLAQRGAHAAIDVSDGLAGDLTHMAVASAVSIEVEASQIPRFEGVSLHDALASGEEYELVVAVSEKLDENEFRTRLGTELTQIGRVASDSSSGRGAERGTVNFRDRGRRVDPPAGYDHFSR